MKTSEIRLPSFLVIGGMKCGSTTLYRDLLGHPDIHIPEKELNALTRHGITQREYAANFDRTKRRDRSPRTISGDVSTTYSMLPHFTGVAEKAVDFLGSETQIIYLVREPISRAVSHHRHMNAWHGPGRMSADINDSVRMHSSLIDYSRYSTQLEPWRRAFGDSSINVVVFEEYIRHRRPTIARLMVKLGLQARTSHIREKTVFNSSDGKTVLSPFWLAVWNTPLYQRFARPLMSLDVRAKLRGTLLPEAPVEPNPPSMETVDYVLNQVRYEECGLRRFLNRDKPIWDFDSVRQRFADLSRSAAA